MQSVSRGYTIMELMIVLAISSLMIIMAANFLSGSRGHTQFSQSMRNLQSKVQSWFGDVTNGYAYGNNSTAYCSTLDGNSIKIKASGRPPNPSPDCIYLGKAVQFTDGPSTAVYAYSVFGLRATGGILNSSLVEAKPTPATGTLDNGDANFTEIYNLQNGATLKSIISSSGISSGGANSHLAGFYLSLNTDIVAGQNGQTDLIAYQYPLGNYKDVNDDNVVNCIENKGLCTAPTGPGALRDWQLCFQSNVNADTAVLSITASANGFSPQTKLDFKPC